MDRIPFPYAGPDRALTARRHGPAGYRSYQSYKPWLRDEHEYCCVYCRARETWLLDGAHPAHAAFGADHILSQDERPDLALEYDNLAYCCNTCNARKNAASLPEQMIDRPLAEHLRIRADGRIEALTNDGAWLRDLLLLDHPERTRRRQVILGLWREAIALTDDAPADDMLAGLFMYPPDLDDLGMLRPPWNSRPSGVEESAFERRRRDELPMFL